jgi:dTDP-3-amino-3,4,6-trideoxy-alpha-D-glucose transaminase
MAEATLTVGAGSTSISVPFLDLGPSHRLVKDDVLKDVSRLIDSNAFTNGPAVGQFEEAFAAFCGVRECIGVGSGLDALRLALLAYGVGPGDEAIVPASTFIATFEAVSQTGATPVPVEIDEHDYTLDPGATASAITPRTRAILPVHLYGQVADMTRLRGVSSAGSIALIEDACQAHGARRDGIRAGSGGHAAAFSFYPGKNLGAFGDAGALVTSDSALADRVRALREHGQRRKYEHDLVGYTARLDTVQAAVLLRKLPHLPEWNQARQFAAAYYTEALAAVGDVVLPAVPAESEPVWHLYVVRTRARDGLLEALRARGIGAGLHYPQPVHLSAAYKGLGYRRGSFPISEMLSDTALSLPMFPGITEAQLSAVVEAVRSYFDDGH